MLFSDASGHCRLLFLPVSPPQLFSKCTILYKILTWFVSGTVFLLSQGVSKPVLKCRMEGRQQASFLKSKLVRKTKTEGMVKLKESDKTKQSSMTQSREIGESTARTQGTNLEQSAKRMENYQSGTTTCF